MPDRTRTPGGWWRVGPGKRSRCSVGSGVAHELVVSAYGVPGWEQRTDGLRAFHGDRDPELTAGYIGSVRDVFRRSWTVCGDRRAQVARGHVGPCNRVPGGQPAQRGPRRGGATAGRARRGVCLPASVPGSLTALVVRSTARRYAASTSVDAVAGGRRAGQVRGPVERDEGLGLGRGPGDGHRRTGTTGSGPAREGPAAARVANRAGAAPRWCCHCRAVTPCCPAQAARPRRLGSTVTVPSSCTPVVPATPKSLRSSPASTAAAAT